MSCRYKYDNREFNTKKDLADYLKGKGVEANYDTNSTLVEIKSNYEDPILYQSQIEQQVEDIAGSLEQISFDGRGFKTYANINQKLLDEQAGTVKIFRDDNGNEIEIDVAEEFEKYRKGEPIQQVEGLLDEIDNLIADKFYQDTMENMSGAGNMRQESLMRRLTDFANKLGISTQKMEDYVKQYQQRNGVPASVEALADMFNKIIAISNTGTVEDFTEEIAHFAVEYFNGQESIQDMVDNVDKTVAYKTYAETYRNLYSKQGLTGEALENKVRREIVGKILAQKILDNFAENETNLSERGIFSVLRKLFGQFLDLFAITDSNRQFFVEFGQTLDYIAQSVTDDTMFSNFTPRESKEVYYSATKEDKVIKRSLEATQKELEEKFRQILRGGEVNLKSSRLKDLERIAQKLGDNDYAGALKGYIDFLYMEIQKNDDQIEKAVADSEAILRNRRLSSEDLKLDPDGYTEEELYQEVARQLDVDAANLIVFNSDIDMIVEHLTNQVNMVKSRNPNLPVNYVRSLNKKIDVIRTRSRNTKNHTTPLAKNVTIREITRGLEKLGLTEEKIQETLDRINQYNDRDIDFWTKLFFAASTVGNPIVRSLVTLLKKANNRAQKRARDFAFKLARKAEQLGITNGEAKKLFEKTHMIAPWDVARFERDFNKAIEDAAQDINNKINELSYTDPDYLEKRTKLEASIDEAQQKIREEWLESQFSNYNSKRVGESTSVNPITKQKTRTRAAQQIIRDLGRNRIEITSKYGRGELMSVRDQRALQTVVNKRKQYMSLYNSDGTIKDKEELAIAYDLRDYYSFDGGSGVSAKASLDFQLERERVRNRYGSTSVEYKRWLSQYAYLKYPDEYYEGISFEVEVDEEETLARLRKAGIGLDEIRELVVDGGSMNIQELYNALRDKKRQLTDPYRIRNKSGEIDGIALERDAILVSAIDEITNYTKYFSLEDSKTGFVAEPNDAFTKKYYDLLKQNDPAALNQWLTKHQAEKRQGAVPLPKTSYYRRYTSKDENIQRDYEPTIQWQMEYEDSLEVNSNFKQELKGKALQPSAAKMNEYKNQRYFDLFGINPNDPFSNSPTRNQKLYELREFLLTEKYFMDKLHGQKYAYLQLPQVRAYANENITSTSRGLKDRIVRVMEDAVIIDNLEDEFSLETTRDNDVFIKGRKGRKIIPKFYTRLVPEGREGELTEDIAYMYGKYAAMSYNYDEKAAVLPKLHAMRDALLSVTNKDSSAGQDRKLSNTIDMVDEYLDSHLYGNQYKDLGGYNWAGVGYISLTKIINTISKFTRKKNLGLNTLVSLTSSMVATLERRSVASENEHLSHSSINFANMKLKAGADLIQMVGETASLRPNSTSRQLLEYTGVGIGLDDVIQGGIMSRGGRAIAQASPLFDAVGYKVVGRMVASVTALSVYDNYRLVDGQFTNYKNFREKNSSKPDSQIEKEWNALRNKSFFSYLKSEDNRMVINEEKLRQDGFMEDVEDLEDRMRLIVQEANDYVEGQVNFMDKNLLSKHPFLAFVLMLHRGYFQRFIENRFKAKGINPLTGSESEGHYRTVLRLMKDRLKNENGEIKIGSPEFMIGALNVIIYASTFGVYTKGLDNSNLSETEKSNLRRIKTDLFVFLSAFAFFVLMNLKADDDDDDDKLKEYLALLSSRVLVETSSTRYNALGGLQSTFDMLESPSAGYSAFESLLSFSDLLFTAGDTIKSGHYKGKSKFFKSAVKATPFKNVYEPIMGNPRNSNMFYRSRLISQPAYIMYEKIEELVNE